MENPTNLQPRDSRLENFTTAASNIIATQRGLTPLALSKIHHLANEQHLSNDQVTQCLNKIGDGGSSLGRVGRYEQIFLERLATDLSELPGAVLSPTNAQEAIQIATDEFQIGSLRARQLLEHAAKQRGLEQISVADARRRIRLLISEKIESSRSQRAFIVSELATYAACFGIDADEVNVMFDAVFEAQNQRRKSRQGRWIAVIALTILALCASVACSVLLLGRETPERSKQPVADSIASAEKLEIVSTATNPVAATPDSSSQSKPDSAPQLPEPIKFEVNDYLSSADKAAVLKFERWQKKFIELADLDFEPSPSEETDRSSADQQKARSAIASLQSINADQRILIRALDDLSEAAQPSDDITPAEAEFIAGFCLQQQDASIRNAVLRAVRNLRRWPNFLLAISDAYAKQGDETSTTEWKRRVADAISNGRLKRNDDYPASFFTMARMRVRERLIEINQVQLATLKPLTGKTKVLKQWVSLLRQFIFEEMNNRAHQDYFTGLINARDSGPSSMQQQLELQQILIEALLFAKPDNESLAVGEMHFRDLTLARTLGEQLAQSRRTALTLASLHLQWLKRKGVNPASQRKRLGTREARRLRDRAETSVLSGDQSLIARAREDYRSAMACGDRAVMRSCLQGLLEIAGNRADRLRCRRQIDFVRGGRLGPLLKPAGGNRPEHLTPRDWQSIVKKCRRLRQSRSSQDSADVATAAISGAKEAEIWAALNWLADRPAPLGIFDLDLLLHIEAAATRVSKTRRMSHFRLELPWPVQATLPAVEVTPLIPLL